MMKRAVQTPLSMKKSRSRDGNTPKEGCPGVGPSPVDPIEDPIDPVFTGKCTVDHPPASSAGPAASAGQCSGQLKRACLGRFRAFQGNIWG